MSSRRVGLLRSNDGGAITLDPVTGTAVIDDPMHLSVSLTRSAPVGTTIYNARLNHTVGFEGGSFWVGFAAATVNRLPQGTTLVPQATISVSIVECATGFLRDFE
jgi:hypothetical protein